LEFGTAVEKIDASKEIANIAFDAQAGLVQEA